MLPYLHIPTNNDLKRMFHGRGKCWPGYEHITIDWIAPVVQITLYKAVEADWLAALVDDIRNRFTLAGCEQPDAIVAQYRDQFASPREWLYGEPCTHLQVHENGLRYHIQLGKAQNMGLFPDMAQGRHWVKANAKGKRVLNLFAYSCGFSVAAMAGGAASVVNVDMAKGPLNMGRENHRLNQHDTRDVRFEAVDIFKSWGRLKRHGPYELLICDPPSFQKGSINIERDYAKIIRRIPELLVEGGQAMLCLNSPSLDTQFLFDEVTTHCPALQFETRLYAGDDFAESEPEKGLKMLLFRYQPDACHG